MIQHLDPAAHPETFEAETAGLPRERTGDGQPAGIAKDIEPLLAGFLTHPADAERTAKLQRGGKRIVARHFAFEVAAHGIQPARAELFAAEQRLAGNRA